MEVAKNLSTEMKQLIVAFTGRKELFEELWAKIPTSLRIIIEESFLNYKLRGEEPVIFCNDIVLEESLNYKFAVDLFIGFLRKQNWEKCFFVFLSLFSRTTAEEQLDIVSKIKPEMEKLKNYVLEDMEITMQQEFGALMQREKFVFKDEKDLILLILTAELYKRDEYEKFIVPFRKKIVFKKTIHENFAHVRESVDTLDSCLLWDWPVIMSTDYPHEMFANIIQKYERDFFDSCFICRYFKLFAFKMVKMRHLIIFKALQEESIFC